LTEETKPILAQKIVIDANLSVFLGQFAEALKDGWEVDPSFPGDVYGYLYEVHLLKDESLIDKTPTRADILANARSAKKLKAEKPAEAPAEETPAKEDAPV
jgi:hypothetical protein